MFGQPDIPHRFASWRAITGWRVADPEMSQDQTKRLSTLIAAHMDICTDAACSDLFVTDDVKPEEVRRMERVAAEAMRLDVRQLSSGYATTVASRCPLTISGSLARMRCADWWY